MMSHPSIADHVTDAGPRHRARYRASLICPTYNERDNIAVLAEEIFSVIAAHPDIDLELIVVDDNSPDRTWEAAAALQTRFPVKILRRVGKLGLGSAVLAGFAVSDRQLLGVIDGDLSHDPAILPDLIRGLDLHDVTIGSRFGVNAGVENWPIHRKLISLLGVAFARRLTGVKDPLSGYFFVRRTVIDGMAGRRLTSNGYKVLLEILMKGLWRSQVSVPYVFRNRHKSTSKLNFEEYVLFAKQITWFSVQRALQFDVDRGWFSHDASIQLHRAK